MEDQQAVLLGYRNVKVVSKQVSPEPGCAATGRQGMLACPKIETTCLRLPVLLLLLLLLLLHR
jgi:hypothetical protein